MDLEKDVLQQVQKSVGESLNNCLTGYNSSFSKIINGVIADHESELRKIIDDSFSRTISSKEFKQAVDNAFNHKLAKLMVSKLEGSVEKAVNILRGEPGLRARMILAIQEIINEQHQPTKGDGVSHN